MRTTAGYSFGPSTIPDSLRWLIIITCCVSIGAPLLDQISGLILGLSGVQYMLSVLWSALPKLYLWQPFTYQFVMQPAGGLSLNLFITLFFRMYLLWVMGTSLIERFGKNSFFKLYFGSGIISGLFFALCASLFGIYGVLFANTPSLLAIFVVWAMMNRGGVIFLFFIFPIQVKWLLACVVGGTVLINLSNGDFLHLISSSMGLISGYLFATFAWGLTSPFPQTHAFDIKLSEYGDRYYETLSHLTTRKTYSKIFDFKTGKARNDDEAFVDAMLEKISKSGKDSLTWWERRRLNKISKKRKPKS